MLIRVAQHFLHRMPVGELDFRAMLSDPLIRRLEAIESDIARQHARANAPGTSSRCARAFSRVTRGSLLLVPARGLPSQVERARRGNSLRLTRWGMSLEETRRMAVEESFRFTRPSDSHRSAPADSSGSESGSGTGSSTGGSRSGNDPEMNVPLNPFHWLQSLFGPHAGLGGGLFGPPRSQLPPLATLSQLQAQPSEYELTPTATSIRIASQFSMLNEVVRVFVASESGRCADPRPLPCNYVPPPSHSLRPSHHQRLPQLGGRRGRKYDPPRVAGRVHPRGGDAGGRGGTHPA